MRRIRKRSRLCSTCAVVLGSRGCLHAAYGAPVCGTCSEGLGRRWAPGSRNSTLGAGAPAALWQLAAGPLGGCCAEDRLPGRDIVSCRCLAGIRLLVPQCVALVLKGLDGGGHGSSVSRLDRGGHPAVA